MYIGSMVSTVKMKPVTVYLQELKYLMFQHLAESQNRKAAELVRDAMDEYLSNHAKSDVSFDSWEPVSLGGLKSGAVDWVSRDYQDEMLEGGAKFDGN